MSMNWYVVRVHTGQEDKIRDRLVKRVKADGIEDRIPEILVPVERVTEVRGGKKRISVRKIYPGYLMLRCDLGQRGTEEESDEDRKVWFAMHETPGFGDFVGGGEDPVPMSAEEVETIRSRMEESQAAPRLAVRTKPGDLVRIKEGPFEGFDGTVEEVLGTKGQLRISVTIFGRATSVQIEHWQVEPV